MHFLGSSALITVSKQNRWFHFQVSRVQPTLWFISRIFFSKFEQPQYGRTKKSLRSVKFLQIILQSNIALQEKVFLREKCVFSIKKVCQPAEVMDWFSSISGKLHVFRSKPEENVPRCHWLSMHISFSPLALKSLKRWSENTMSLTRYALSSFLGHSKSLKYWELHFFSIQNLKTKEKRNRISRVSMPKKWKECAC